MARVIRKRGQMPAVRLGMGARSMAEALFPIIYESPDLLVINKPAGLVCHPSKHGPRSSLIGRIRLYLGEGREAHLINRLDRETSGLVLVAKEREGARFLRRIWERRQVTKEYLAIAHGHPAVPEWEIDAPLGSDEASVISVKDCVRDDGAASLTMVSVLENFESDGENYSLLKVVPRTGRKHQIRIHLQFSGFPLLGDKIYGIVPEAYLNLCEGTLSLSHRERLVLENQALHAVRLDLEFMGKAVEMRAELNPAMREFCVRAGVPTHYLPSEDHVTPELGDRFVEAFCRDSDATQLEKRSNWSGSRRKCLVDK